LVILAEILVIEDEPILARNVCESLDLSGHSASSAPTGEAGLEAAQSCFPDLILLDYRLPGIDGLEVIRELRKVGNQSSIIMMTAHGNIDTAVEAMKRGASDFLTKPLDLTELRLVIERVLDHRAARAQLSYFHQREKTQSSQDRIVGDCQPLREVKDFITRITSTQALASQKPPSILITGETGTGKDLIARAIHYAGPRRDAPFVHVNTTAMPEQLVESELFGHVKGAFTDARSDKRGLFEIAEKGTLFLDEVGHMKLELQAKLLSVLDQHVIRPVGGMKERSVNVHVIAATNRDLKGAIESGEFREDLYHRLRVLNVIMPPLRHRGTDIEKLATHFLAVCGSRYGLKVERFSEDALKLIREYDWPGNVRELLHTIESAVLMMDGAVVRPEHLNVRRKAPEGGVVLVAGTQKITVDFARETPKLDDIEHEIILAALEYAHHNVSRAARILGISRDAVRYRLEKFRKRGDAP